MSSKIVNFKQANKPKSILATFDELRDGLENDRVSDFIIISRVKNDEPNDEYDGHLIKYNWMGRDSSILCLGLLEYMAEKIKNWIWDRE
jgi:hypothetical protein